ncbi:hypothetical protein Y032_0248g85 [Ancylostoma ceylanicum]|uniref:Lipid-binding serum glycoprotein N-terminal domain-containing protein n=1 Tax=Ancylostoma ceylanicum TaxID=53326 RepID=A0A016SCF0_9BILA|nr:hypothetical protein Y032_0248g85 [Ancylostoma ceylanicum]
MLQLPLIRYRVDNGRINYFHVPKRDVSFYDYKGGVRWTMNLRFEATTHAKIFVVWIFPIFGKIIAKSEFAYLDVKLLWNNFKLTPYISMHSKINIEFTHGLKFFLSFLRGTVANKVSSAINTKVPVMINEAIERHVNPRLQKLKQKLISNNYTNYDIDWQVRGKHFRVVVKPRSRNGVESALKPIEHMMCVDLNVLDVIGEASKVMKKAANNSSTVTASPVMRVIQSSSVWTRMAQLGINGIDFTCVNPKFNCEGSSCSLCTDVDFNLALLSYADKFRDCLPRS